MANYVSDSRLIPRIRQVFIKSGKSNFSNLAAKGVKDQELSDYKI
jgi:hypothetical protein